MKRPAITLLVCMFLAACGQYPGVHEEAVRSGEIAPAGAEGTLGGTGTTTEGTTGLPTDTGTGTGVTGTTTGGTTTGGTTGGGTTGGGGGGADDTTATGGGDATGVTESTITIGIHAPLTGAAPLKSESFNSGKDLYWEQGNNGGKVTIHGRTVKVVFQDDQYNPSHARAVCQQMAEQQNAFLLIGGGGTDQIQACAQYAASRGIPYLSAGVTEVGVSQLPNYFAVSMSYADQAPLVAQYIKANQSAFGWNGQPNRVAMVATNTPNFSDAVTAFQQAMPGVKIIRPSKNDRGSSMAAQLCSGVVKNYDIVFPITAPTYFLEMAGASKCEPQYVGVGVTMGLNQVASTGCRTGGVADSRFFSPAPAFAQSGQYDPVFAKAKGTKDDIVFLLWGISKVLHQLFLKAGPNLTREGFIQSTSNASVKTGVYPDLQFSPNDHFGASQVHVLRADCGSGQYQTETAFYS
ncbi:MAG: ABC transporter substrate-binding protein [Actinomycetota bacterium]|nr:ABC transporter substrate-binding protein [Actinomycetota bacterium]